MNKQAMLDDIYNKAMADELEKLGFKFLKKLIPSFTATPTKKAMQAPRISDVKTVSDYKLRLAKIKAATAAGKSVY